MVLPSKNRPFIDARLAISLVPAGQILADRYQLIATANAAAGATTINLAIDQINEATAAASAILEIEDDHQIWLPGGQAVATAAAIAIGQRVIALDNGAGEDPKVEPGDLIRFANHRTLYRVGRVNGGAIRIFPPIAAIVANNTAVRVYQEIRANLGVDQVMLLNTAGINVPVSGVKYAVTAASSNSLPVRAEKQIFGISTLNVSPTVNSFDTSDTRSPNKEFITGSGLNCQVETNALEGDLGRPEMVLPVLLDTAKLSSTGFFLNVRTAAGEIYQGPASPTESASSNSSKRVETFNVSFSFDLANLVFWLSI